MSKLIPFWLFPGSWGLRGETRRLAEIDYLYSNDPYQKQLELNKLKYEPGKELEIATIKTNMQYDQIDREAGLRQLAELESLHENDREKRLLEIDREFNKVDSVEYEKKLATLNGEPWVRVKNFDTDNKNPARGSLELDWNEHFVDFLETHGYGPNPRPEDTVDQWLNELCRNIALDAFDGVGDNSEKLSVTKKTVHQDVVFKSQLPNNGEEK